MEGLGAADDSREHFVPIFEPVRGYNAIENERVTRHEFLGGLASREYTHGASVRRNQRTCHEQDTSGVEFGKASAMSREVSGGMCHTFRCNLVEHDYLHETLPQVKLARDKPSYPTD
jgi:hypothetical protein